VNRDPGNTVESLKPHIEEKLGIPTRLQKLIVIGAKLSDKSTLTGVKTVYALKIQETKKNGTSKGNENPFQVCVKTLTGKTISLLVTTEDTIEDLKWSICGEHGIPVRSQRFIFGGKQLDNDETVGSIPLLDMSTIHLALRLTGGMFHLSSGYQPKVALGIQMGRAMRDLPNLVNADHGTLTYWKGNWTSLRDKAIVDPRFVRMVKLVDSALQAVDKRLKDEERKMEDRRKVTAVRKSMIARRRAKVELPEGPIKRKLRQTTEKKLVLKENQY
jgi:hypothetical protein